jgi:hypothetical protein
MDIKINGHRSLRMLDAREACNKITGNEVERPRILLVNSSFPFISISHFSAERCRKISLLL